MTKPTNPVTLAEAAEIHVGLMGMWECSGVVSPIRSEYAIAGFLAGAAFQRAQENEKLKRAIKVLEYYQHDDQIGKRAREFLKEMRDE